MMSNFTTAVFFCQRCERTSKEYRWDKVPGKDLYICPCCGAGGRIGACKQCSDIDTLVEGRCHRCRFPDA